MLKKMTYLKKCFRKIELGKMEEAMEKNKKLFFILAAVIIILSIGIVPKVLQNDTFFNISIGKYILDNGIDMQEHFSFVDRT